MRFRSCSSPLAFVVAYAWPILDPRLDHDVATPFLVLTWTVWGAFAVDLLIRLVLADQRLEYAARHWYDVVLPVAVPMLPHRSASSDCSRSPASSDDPRPGTSPDG